MLFGNPSPAQLRYDATLRHLAANGTIAFVPDKKAPPPGWSLDTSHLNGCVSCFDEEYRTGLHAKPLLISPGVAVLLLDDQAIEGVVNIVRLMETPSKRVTDLRCPGRCNKGGSQEHLKKNHFGMYGSVAYDKGKYRIWLGEWQPYYSESVEFGPEMYHPLLLSSMDEFPCSSVSIDHPYSSSISDVDGVNWAPLRLMQQFSPHGWSPRNLCIWRDPHERRPPHVYKMGYHCGNFMAEESTCMATSPDGFKWQPYNGGSPGTVSSNAKLRAHQIRASCGPGCVSAADTLNCFHHSEADGSYWVVNRRNFGTEERWREIRGVRLSINRKFLTNFSNFVEKRAWYFDRLGKEERFQRQIYSLGITSLREEGIHLGILTVIEWPKIGSVYESHPLPPYKHDYMSVYLITSRDGELFDLSSVYSYNRLIPRGVCSSAVRDHVNWIEASMSGCEFDHGYVQPASGFVADDKGNHHLYYEGRPVQHEDRWKVPATIAVASWQRHRITALTRRPDASAPCGEIVTRPFVLNGSELLLNADTSAKGSSMSVDVVSASSGLSLAKGIVSGNGDSLMVWWERGQLPSLHGRQVKLRISLCGAAKVYAFTFV
ncbi:MAG: hypothetical protein SGPRY_004303 [Prymnesium sp.]